MRMSKKEFEKDEGRRGQQRLKEEFSKAIKDATTPTEEKTKTTKEHSKLVKTA